MRKLKLLIVLAVLHSLAIPVFAQDNITVAPISPQLPTSLGPLGGLKVECLIGCGGGAAGTDVNISGIAGTILLTPAIPVSKSGTWDVVFTSAQPVTQSGAWSISFTAPQHIICDSGCGTVTPGQQTMANSSPVVIASDQSSIPVTIPSNSSVNVSQLNATTTDTNSGLKSAGTLRVVLATDQPALTNKLLVTPDSVALPANQSVNVNQLAGTATDTNSGLKSAGTLRVVLSTDQPQLTNKLLVTPDSVALPANQSVNVAQLAGTATTTNSGLKDAGTLRVVLATDQPALTNKLLVTPDALPANQSVNVAQVAGTATDTNSGLKSAGTVRVVLATDQPALTNKLLVTPDANSAVNVAQFGANNVVTGTGAGGVGIPRVTVSNDSNVLITPPTLTKGTQGSTGFTSQDLKDAGRTAISFYGNAIASGTTGTETLLTLTQSRGTNPTANSTTYAVPNGKTLRITALQFGSRGNTTATAQITTFSLRMNTAGNCIVTSTPILMAVATATPATALAWDRSNLTIPDGYEVAGNGTVAICITANSVFVTNAPTWFVNLLGFEY